MNDILDRVKNEAEAVNYELMGRKLHYPFQLEFKQVNGGQIDRTLDIGKWTAQSKMVFQADFKNITLPKLFRIGKAILTLEQSRTLRVNRYLLRIKTKMHKLSKPNL